MSLKSNRSYRIGIDARFFRSETGGIGRYSRELIHHLAQIDQINSYTIFLTEKDVSEWTLNQPNFKFKVVPAEHFSYAEQTLFLKALYAEKLDLVHFLNFNHPLLYQRPFVTTLHDLTMYLFPAGKSQKSKIRHLIFKHIYRRSLTAAKKVIAISEHSAHDAEKYLGISHAKMEVIYEGGPEPVELPFGNKAVTQEYLGTKEPYFLFVSQWRAHKGLITLIEAFTRFKEKTGASHKLVLTGKQKVLEQEIKTALAASPYTQDIITPGFVPEEMLPYLYRNAFAFVMPSEYEGFGLPVLEAFAQGAPVISARNSSLTEVVGKAGLLFTTKSVPELAECMERILTESQLRNDLIQQGYQQLQKFSWARMADQTLKVYLSILEKKR